MMCTLIPASPQTPAATILQHSWNAFTANTICTVAHFAGSRSLAFAIRTSTIQGRGAFATRAIRKNERLIEYLGECIDDAESDIRYPDDEMARHHTFLFAIGDGTRVLDAGPLDWPAKYINHSCDPNCEATEEEDGRVFISALRKIEDGTELLYDYAYERTAEHTPEDEQLYLCQCGSPKCRGSILAPPAPVKKKKKDKKSKKNKKNRKEERDEKDDKRQRDSAEMTESSSAATAPASKKSAKRVKKNVNEGVNAAAKSGTKNAGKRGVKKGVKKGVKSGVKKRSTRTQQGSKAAA